MAMGAAKQTVRAELSLVECPILLNHFASEFHETLIFIVLGAKFSR